MVQGVPDWRLGAALLFVVTVALVAAIGSSGSAVGASGLIDDVRVYVKGG